MHVCASVCLFVPVFAISKLEHLFEECPLIVFVLCVYIYIYSLSDIIYQNGKRKKNLFIGLSSGVMC